MVEKKITDKNIIRNVINKEAEYLIIQYNEKNKRAWFRTNDMSKRKAIDLNRVVNL